MITLVLGNVGTGKTTELIRLMEKRAKTDNCLFFKPRADHRHSGSTTATHANKKVAAIPIYSLEDILNINLEDVDAIFVDDVHTFEDETSIDTLLDLSLVPIDIYCAARDINFAAFPYSHVGYLACAADKIIKLQGKCHSCGLDARYCTPKRSQTMHEAFPRDLDDYVLFCEPCYYMHIGEGAVTQLDYTDQLRRSVKVNIYLEDSEHELIIPMDVLDEAGWTIDEINDIISTEGVQRLINDLVETGWDAQ